jgi:cell division transport system ATP-binding protein
MIEFQNVTFSYNGSVAALRDINLKAEKGEFVFVVGQTGTGKSTLLRMVYRELVPDTGRVIVAGRDVTKLRPREVPYLRRRVGVVFQDFKLLPKKTVWENIAFALDVIGASKQDKFRRIPRILSLVGLSEKSDSFPRQLSGGEGQRVSIARALVNDPPILLADEPTGNLDPQTSFEIVQLLNKINIRGTTVLMATHDREIVDRMQKRVVTLVDAHIVRDQESAPYEGN